MSTWARNHRDRRGSGRGCGRGLRRDGLFGLCGHVALVHDQYAIGGTKWAGDVKGGVAVAVGARTFAAAGAEAVNAGDGAGADGGGGVGGEGAALEGVVGEGVRASTEWADVNVRLSGAVRGGVAEGLAVVTLLKCGAVTKSLHMDGLAKEGWAAFLEAGKDGVVWVKEGEDN